MKKNTLMRIASVLLVVVLATTCVISGTFAKYITKDSAADSARVAKWGVTVEVTGDDAFANEYTDDVASNEDADAEVKGASAALVVAPGTEGTLTTVAINGTPEVAVNVAATVNLDLVGTLAANAWMIGDPAALYCPLVIMVGATEFKIDATNDTLAKLEAAVEKEIIKQALGLGTFDVTVNDGVTTYDADYAPLNNFGTSGNDVVVTWEWAFHDFDDAISEKDTALGDAGTASTIAMSVSFVVSQIDDYTAPTP